MKCLTAYQANLYLNSVDLEIGDWNQIAGLGSQEIRWVNFHAPDKARELFNFSCHVAGWIPFGEWKIFQVDNSTYLNAAQSIILSQLMSEFDLNFDCQKHRTFLFEFGAEQKDNEKTELLIANLIHLFFLFEGNCYLVSSNKATRNYISIQDGFAYFYSNELESVNIFLEKFKKKPLAYPEWVASIIGSGQ